MSEWEIPVAMLDYENKIAALEAECNVLRMFFDVVDNCDCDRGLPTTSGWIDILEAKVKVLEARNS